jgi:hypothetical protein
MSEPQDKFTIPEGTPLELLTLAREKAVALLNKLLAEQAEAEWDPARVGDKRDPEAASGWRHAMTCAIESARRTLAAIEAAMKVAPGAPEPPAEKDETEGHRWN